jgi:hypothetical protein
MLKGLLRLGVSKQELEELLKGKLRFALQHE